MFIEELIKELNAARKIGLMVQGEDLLDKWFASNSYNSDSYNEADIDSMKALLFETNLYSEHFLTVVSDAHHFSYLDIDPIAPVLPLPKDTPIEDLPGILSTVSANLPYRVMTLSYRSPTDHGNIPHVALLEELCEGLINIQIWKKENGLFGKWSYMGLNLIISTRGSFTYWDGLVDYYKENGLTDMVPLAERAEGFVFLHQYLNIEEDKKGLEAEIGLMEIDLYSYIIPYLYLLNIKGIPIKECRSINSYGHKLKKAKKGEIPIPFIIYKKINIDLPAMINKTGSNNSSTREDVRRRLHLCRGHIKEYTSDRPLFGRYIGMVWCPAHVRGDLSNGVVIKDYQSKLRR